MPIAPDHIYEALHNRLAANDHQVELARDTNGDAVAYAHTWEDLTAAGLVRPGTYRESFVCEALDIRIVFSDEYVIVYPGDSTYVTGAEEPTVYNTEVMYIWDTPEAEFISNNYDNYLVFSIDASFDDTLQGLRDLFGDDNPAQHVTSPLLVSILQRTDAPEADSRVSYIDDMPCDRYGTLITTNLPDGTIAIPIPDPFPSYYPGDPTRPALLLDVSYDD